MKIKCKGIYLHRPMVFVGFFLLSLAACTKPCVSLGYHICGCIRNAEERQQCQDEVDMRVKVYAEKGLPASDDEFCAKLIDSETCNCNDINNYDFEKCLLTRPGRTP